MNVKIYFNFEDGNVALKPQPIIFCVLKPATNTSRTKGSFDFSIILLLYRPQSKDITTAGLVMINAYTNREDNIQSDWKCASVNICAIYKIIF